MYDKIYGTLRRRNFKGRRNMRVKIQRNGKKDKATKTRKRGMKLNRK
jgi:hypothetical protein